MQKKFQQINTWYYPTDDADFIKSMVRVPNSLNKLLVTTENSQLFTLEQQNNQLSMNLLKQCSGPIYDSLIIEDLILVISQRESPLCLYKMEDNNKLSSIGRISDIKSNSELYLTPIEMKYRSESKDIVGCGRGFLHSYDFNKLKVSHHYKCINKDDYASCLDVPDETSENSNQTNNLVAVGYFDKTVRVYNLKEEKLLTTLKIHIGGITQVTFSPKNSLCLYTAARQDNFVYEWDLRNTSSFVRYYERINCTNQRTQFYTDGSNFVLGNDDGTAVIHQGVNNYKVQVCEEETCVNSSSMLNDGQTCIFAFGEREFNFDPTNPINHRSGITVFQQKVQ